MTLAYLFLPNLKQGETNQSLGHNFKKRNSPIFGKFGGRESRKKKETEKKESERNRVIVKETRVQSHGGHFLPVSLKLSNLAHRF